MPNIHCRDVAEGPHLDALCDCPLAAAMLKRLGAIAAECDVLLRTTAHYSLTKHVHAIEESVDQMVQEITGRE